MKGVNKTTILGIIFIHYLDFLRLLTLPVNYALDIILHLLEVIHDGGSDHFISGLQGQ